MAKVLFYSNVNSSQSQVFKIGVVSFLKDLRRLSSGRFIRIRVLGKVHFSLCQALLRSCSGLSGSFLSVAKVKVRCKIESRWQCGLLQPSSPAFKVGCLTQRAADKWESARFSSLFLALSFLRLISRVSSHPLVG